MSIIVVSYLVPTSNHNYIAKRKDGTPVVSYLVPTSNHNRPALNNEFIRVVSYLVPTSNHNPEEVNTPVFELYLIWFLHQTTTSLS